MPQTTSVSPGAALVRARWSRPENVAKRVARLERELAAVASYLTQEQATRLRAALRSTKGAAA